MSSGYVKIYRSIEASGILEDGPMLQVFMKALLDAAYSQRQRTISGTHITLEPGEFVFGRKAWGALLGLSDKVVRDRIGKLQKRATIRATIRASKFTVFRFINWDTYQCHEGCGGPAEGPAEGPTEGQQRASRGPAEGHILKKERKKEGKNKNTPQTPQGGYSASFEEFWAAYPRKTGKAAAYKAWKAVPKKSTAKPPIIIAAIKAQVEAGHFQGQDGNNYIPNPATWLNQGRWEDEIRPPQPKDPLAHLTPKMRAREESAFQLRGFMAEEVRRAEEELAKQEADRIRYEKAIKELTQ